MVRVRDLRVLTMYGGPVVVSPRCIGGQHQWAEVTEKLGDIVGRGLRYGETPVNPIAAQLHLQLKALANAIHSTEQAIHRIETAEAVLYASTSEELQDQPEFQGISKELGDLVASITENKDEIEGMLAGIREDVVEFEKSLGRH